jgi:ESX secretion system ATPase EccB
VPSRQDQLHSYQYSLQRVVAALVTHDADPQRSPLRKAGTTALVSLLIASLAVVAAMIYGVFTGHSNVEPTDTKVVFQEKGSGARFVYLDGKLHPVLNYTSGLLLADGDAPQMTSISAAKLAKVELGDPLGIPGAPDSLPTDDALLKGRWSVCTANTGLGNSPRSTVLVGAPPTDGTVAATADKALLVRDTEKQTYLIAGNRRFAFPPSRTVETLRALGWADQQPWPVSTTWTNAVPPGPDLVAPAIAGKGSPSAIEGFSVGQLVTDGVQYGVILRDGFSPITETQARLLQALGAEPPLGVGSRFNTIKGTPTPLGNDLPEKPPALFDGTLTSLCMTLPVDGAHPDGVRINATVPHGTPVTGHAPGSKGLADFVSVARGKGAVVVAAASPSAPASTGTVSVVTDTGRRYPLASRALLGKLGYGTSQPVPISSQLVDLLPQGPSLDPVRARQTNPQG